MCVLFGTLYVSLKNLNREGGGRYINSIVFYVILVSSLKEITKSC